MAYSDLNIGFNPKVRNFIDKRLLLSKAEMLSERFSDTGSKIILTDISFCICTDDTKIYTYNINNSVNPETGKFRLLTENNFTTKLKEQYDEAVRLLSASGGILDQLNVEITRAKDAEAGIRLSVSEEAAKARRAEAVLTEDLIDEVDRATKAEADILDVISDETARALTAERIINAKLATETADRTAADEALNISVELEKSRATQVENTLNTHIAAIESDYLVSSDKSYLNTKITEEEARAKSYEQQLGILIARLNELISELSENKVDKVAGKGLSTNDFTDAYKEKLDSIIPGGQQNVQSDWAVTDVSDDAYIKNKPVLENSLAQDSEGAATVTAIRAFVNSSIQSLAANYVTYDVDGNAFPSHGSLINAEVVYQNGIEYTPVVNDYAIITQDETHNNQQCRYLYTGSMWNFLYVVGSAFTAEQQAVLSSGITKELTEKITTDGQILDIHTNNSSIHVSASDKAIWNNKQEALSTANPLSADYITNGQINKVYTTAEKTKLAAIPADAEANVIDSIKINGSEATPINGQVDLGYVATPEDIEHITYDTATKTLKKRVGESGSQEVLVSLANITTQVTTSSKNGNIRVDGVELPVYNDTALNNKVTAVESSLSAETSRAQNAESSLQIKIDEKANTKDVYTITQTDTLLANKQTTLTDNQLLAVNSGINATKITKYDGYQDDIDNLGNIKQNVLVDSGSLQNIKMINGESILGKGEITIRTDATEFCTGEDLETRTYEQGKQYYCIEASESFKKDHTYIATSASTIVEISQTTISTAPAIVSFGVSTAEQLEIGKEVKVNYSYTLKKYQKFEHLGIFAGASSSSVIQITPTSNTGNGTIPGTYNNSTTFTFKDTELGIYKTASITALYRQFYGVVDSEDLDTVLSTLSNVTVSTDRLQTYVNAKTTLPKTVTVKVGGSTSAEAKPVYFVVPNTAIINKVKCGSVDVPITLLTDNKNFTNSFGSTYSVRVYRTTAKLFGTWDFEINPTN